MMVVGCDGSVTGGTDPGLTPSPDARTTSPDGQVSRPDAGAADATLDTSTLPDAVIPSGMVPVTVASGRGGRTAISCDDGQTWIEDRIETGPMVRCWGHPNGAEPECLDPTWTRDSGVDCPDPNPNWLECDHQTNTITGLIYHDGWFIRSAGWGTPGRTQRSQDGVTWGAPVPDFERTYLGLIPLQDAVVAMGTPAPYISMDGGQTWAETEARLGWEAGHVRRATSSDFGPMGSIVFITDRGIWWSADRGVTFNGPASEPCDGNFASGGDVTVLSDRGGAMCTTRDGGQTWDRQGIADEILTNPVWNGTAFHVWGMAGGEFSHFASPDGVRWERTGAGERVNVRVVGATLSGTLIGINGVWNGGYEAQTFYRSDDGHQWRALTAGTDFVQGHPIARFVSGVVPANEYCTGQ